MNFHRTALAAAIAAAILMPCVARGAGYGIYEQGAAVLGMAGAGTVSVHDASADFYNPAALVALKGQQVYFGGTWLSTHVSFAGVDPYPGFATTEKMKTGAFFPPEFYCTRHFGSRWATGIGVNAPFGLGVDWENPDTFTGRERVTKGSLRTINANLSLAFAPTPAWSFGAGFDALYAGVELHNIMAEVVPGGGGGKLDVARTELKGGYKPGYGYNLGVLWSPDKLWQFGLTYRGNVDVKIDDGNASFTQIMTGDAAFDAAVTAALPPAQKVATTLHFPSILSFGAAWKPNPGWTWEVDATQTGWSKFNNLPLSFKTTPAINDTIVEDYADSWRLSVGAEHQLKSLTYRFGYYFDQAAAPSESMTPLLPDANRHGVTLGLGWTLGQSKAWNLDLYNLALFVEDRSTNGVNRDGYNGTYKSYINATGASLAYHW